MTTKNNKYEKAVSFRCEKNYYDYLQKHKNIYLDAWDEICLTRMNNVSTNIYNYNTYIIYDYAYNVDSWG